MNSEFDSAAPDRAANSHGHRPSIFSSFWLAGFESACHINRQGERLDLVCATQHDRELEADYARVRDLGFSAVRESVRWHLVDRGPRRDFSTVRAMLAAA